MCRGNVAVDGRVDQSKDDETTSRTNRTGWTVPPGGLKGGAPPALCCVCFEMTTHNCNHCTRHLCNMCSAVEVDEPEDRICEHCYQRRKTSTKTITKKPCPTCPIDLWQILLTSCSHGLEAEIGADTGDDCLLHYFLIGQDADLYMFIVSSLVHLMKASGQKTEQQFKDCIKVSRKFLKMTFASLEAEPSEERLRLVVEFSLSLQSATGPSLDIMEEMWKFFSSSQRLNSACRLNKMTLVGTTSPTWVAGPTGAGGRVATTNTTWLQETAGPTSTRGFFRFCSTCSHSPPSS